IRSVIRRNPGVCVAAVGCYAQVAIDELKTIEGLDYIIGTADKMRLGEIIREPAKQPEPVVVTRRAAREHFTIDTPGLYPSHTRANLKVQEGCNFVCSFCIVPRSRGPARSRDFDDAVREARALAAEGHREIIITGINVGTYDDRGRTLADVTARVPNIGLGTDVIVGFPGEDESAFERTRALVDAVPFTNTHVFSFSARRGTGAFGLPDQIPGGVIAERSRILHDVGEARKTEFYREQYDRRLRVLFEERDGLGRYVGFSDNYVKVAVRTADELANRMAEVQVNGLSAPDPEHGTPRVATGEIVGVEETAVWPAGRTAGASRETRAGDSSPEKWAGNPSPETKAGGSSPETRAGR
ncbi:MAG: radical SAM protein, partial [bacterium]